jgi:hypothetical protein
MTGCSCLLPECYECTKRQVDGPLGLTSARLPKTDPELLVRLFEAARNHQPTPRQIFEQRVSFVWGQMAEGGLSKDDIRRRLAQHGGYPADYAEPPGESVAAKAASFGVSPSRPRKPD